MPLRRAQGGEVYQVIRSHNPPITTFHDVLYIPLGVPGIATGLYDRGRKLISQGAYFRGGSDIRLVHSAYITKLRPEHYPIHEDEYDYVFCENISDHYGHFILATLSRFWNISELKSNKVKFLYINGSIESFFKRGFIRDIFRVLGVSESDFARFDGPVRLPKVIVPSPGFEESNFVYEAYARLCHRIGTDLTKDIKREGNDTPVYISKTRLSKGISKIINEDEFVDVLEGRGVDIVYPENMSLTEQICLFRDRPVVSGTNGSALHTSIFNERSRIVAWDSSSSTFPNQLMLDEVNNNRSLYLSSDEEVDEIPRNEHFHHLLKLRNPRGLADMFSRSMDRFIDNCRYDESAARGGKSSHAGGASRANIARRMPARQSSTSPYSFYAEPSRDAAGAVSGLLTGGHQFHTSFEDQPWWEVDLLGVCSIAEVRVYNRMDGVKHKVPERSANLRLLTSLDGHNYVEGAQHRGDAFGGLDGNPFVWQPFSGTRARFVRIQLPGRGFLHLDQVEVFGERESPIEVRGGNSQIIMGESNVIGCSGCLRDAFSEKNIVKNQVGIVYERTQSGYWLSDKSGNTEKFILIDMMGDYIISEFVLFNTHNHQYNDRGTGRFCILAGNSVEAGRISNPVPIVAASLDAVSSKQDLIAGQGFPVLDDSPFRYIEFVPKAVACTGQPASSTAFGLNELRIFGRPANQPVRPVSRLEAWFRKRR